MITVHNPADGSVVGEIQEHTAEDVKAAIGRATEAFPAWAGLLAIERRDILKKWHDLMKAAKDEIAAIMTAENGKPLAEAKGEIDYALGFVDWYAEEARRAYGDTIPTHVKDGRAMVIKQPLGVVCAITPWNFPIGMVTRKVSPALAAGCTVVLKPAESTPLTALKVLELARQAGIPENVFQIVTGDPKIIGEVMTSDTRVAALSFTGSTDVGRLLMKQASSTVKKLTMELGGNAPFVVFEKANIDEAVKGLMFAKFRNTGQVCIAPNRVFVQKSVFDEFARKLVPLVEKLKVGNGKDDGVQVGPLINKAGFDKVENLVAKAVANGAKVLTGGKKHAAGDLFYTPTVLTDIPADQAITCTEIFGPVIVLYPFETEAEAIKLANDTEFGLVGYAYTTDLGQAFRVSEAMEVGMAVINTGSVGTASVPFGGVKQSGYGREGSHYAVDEYMNVKYVMMGGLAT